MIRRVVDFALEKRLLVLAVALLVIAAGIASFHALPIEAYPDVADNYVEVITQWPGISAEQIEQQVTIPLEIVMNGIPHVTHLRSFSLFGLSDIKLVFDDEEENFKDRERALERLSQVNLPPGVVPQMGTDWSPAGQIYFITLHSSNPAYDVMELKSIEDWVVEKNFKAVENIVDVASFGGPTREYQVRVDPDKLISYGLSIGQVEQQITNNNANAGGSFIEAGLQQVNIREVGLVRNVRDIQNTVILTRNGTPLHIRDIATVSQGPKIRLGQFARAIRHEDGHIVDNDDVVLGIVLLRKDAEADTEELDMAIGCGNLGAVMGDPKIYRHQILNNLVTALTSQGDGAVEVTVATQREGFTAKLTVLQHGAAICTVVLLDHETTFQACFDFGPSKPALNGLTFNTSPEDAIATVPAATRQFANADNAAAWLLDYLQSVNRL